MLTLRCTQKLQKGLRGRIPGPPVASTTVLGDWYGDLSGVGHRRLVIFMSERSLLPVILEQRDLRDLPMALQSAGGEILSMIGVPPQVIEAELKEMNDRVGPTRSRSVLGSMNDMKQSARLLLKFRKPSLLSLEMQLVDTPSKPLGYRSPREVTLELLGARPVGYPIATVAYYGPTDRQATKVTVAILTDKDEVAFIERWSLRTLICVKTPRSINKSPSSLGSTVRSEWR